MLFVIIGIPSDLDKRMEEGKANHAIARWHSLNSFIVLLRLINKRGEGFSSLTPTIHTSNPELSSITFSRLIQLLLAKFLLVIKHIFVLNHLQSNS